MKKYLCIFLTLLISCGPSEAEIEERIEQAVEQATSTTTSTTSTTSTTTTTTTTTTLPPRYGEWTVDTNTSALDDSVSFYGSVNSIKTLKSKYDETTPRLVIRCRDGEYDMYVDTDHVLTPYYDGDIGQVIARVRLGDNEPETLIMEEGVDSEVVFFRSPELLIGFMTTAKTMLFEITPYDSNTDYAEFNMEGIYNLVSDMQDDCKSKRVNVGMLIAKNNIPIDKFVRGTSDYFWGENSSGDEMIYGFGVGFGNSEFLPLNVRMQGNWENNVLTNIQNKILGTFGKVLHIEFVDGDADIIIHANKDSFSKQFGSRDWNTGWDGSFYSKDIMRGKSFDYCGLIDHKNGNNVESAFASCLGIKINWSNGGTISSVSFPNIKTFIEGEISTMSEIDLAMIGLAYHNPPSLGSYTKEAYKEALGKYTP